MLLRRFFQGTYDDRPNNHTNTNESLLDVVSGVQDDLSSNASNTNVDYNDNVPTVTSLPEDDNDVNQENLFNVVSQFVSKQTETKVQDYKSQMGTVSEDESPTSFKLDDLRCEYPPQSCVITSSVAVTAADDNIIDSRPSDLLSEVADFREQSTSTGSEQFDEELSFDQLYDLPPALPASLPPSSVRPKTLPLQHVFDNSDLSSPSLAFVLPPPSPYATSPSEPTSEPLIADDSDKCTAPPSLNSIRDTNPPEASTLLTSIDQTHNELAQEESPLPIRSSVVSTNDQQQLVSNTMKSGVTDDKCAVISPDSLKNYSMVKDQKTSSEIASYLSLIGGCGYSNRRQMATAVRAMIAKSSTSSSEQSQDTNGSQTTDGNQHGDNTIQCSTNDERNSALARDKGPNEFKLETQPIVNHAGMANDQKASASVFYEKEESNNQLEAKTGESTMFDDEPTVSDTSKLSGVGLRISELASAAFSSKDATCEGGGGKQGDIFR